MAIHRLQALDAPLVQPADLNHGAQAVSEGAEFVGPYLRQIEAMRFTKRPTLQAFYRWRQRRGIRVYGGLVRKRDLELALRRRVPKRRMAAASLANLARKASR